MNIHNIKIEQTQYNFKQPTKLKITKDDRNWLTCSDVMHRERYWSFI
jgi:hypothetical protein